MNMISAVMCTYGRFSCVERAMNCFLQQTHQNKELIIFNTDVESPYFDNFAETIQPGHVTNLPLNSLPATEGSI